MTPLVPEHSAGGGGGGVVPVVSKAVRLWIIEVLPAPHGVPRVPKLNSLKWVGKAAKLKLAGSAPPVTARPEESRRARPIQLNWAPASRPLGATPAKFT